MIMKNKTIVCLLISLLLISNWTNAQTKTTKERSNKVKTEDVVKVGVATGVILGQVLKSKAKKDKKPKKDKSNTTDTPEEFKIDASKITQDLVFFNLFGNTKVDANKVFVWKPKDNLQLPFDLQEIISYDGQLHTSLDNIYYYTNNGKETAAAVLFTYKYTYSDYDKKYMKATCRICYAALGVVTYQKELDGTWKVFNSTALSQLVPFSAANEIKPDYKFENWSDNMHVLSFNSDFGMGGEFTTMTNYIALDNMNFLKEILSITTSETYDNAMNEKKSYSITRKIELSDAKDSPYKIVTLKVAKNNKVLPNEIYTFSEMESRYVLKETPTVKTATKKKNTSKPIATTTKPKSKIKTTNTVTTSIKTKQEPAAGKVKSTATIKMD